MRYIKSLMVALLLPIVISGCATPKDSPNYFLKCVVVPAIIGGAAGAAVGIDDTKAAIGGGVIGAASGAVLGQVFCAPGEPPDSDGDGVPDESDKCPGTPAGVEVDADGCPMDSDGDGVPDYQDNCPDTPEGTRVDANGCPIVEEAMVEQVAADSDGDGVPDNLDRCPNTPPGQRVDANGCPEVGGMLIVLEGVLFDFNKATIKPEYRSVLDQGVNTMNDNPALEVLIVGHTDSVGPEAYNQRLSERRANSVRDYLVSQGIAASRVDAVGRGESEPIASNDTKDGQAQNRRVDFVVTAK